MVVVAATIYHEAWPLLNVSAVGLGALSLGLVEAGDLAFVAGAGAERAV
jgi:hypothetical protein